MDKHQTARYRGETRAEAEDAWRRDRDTAAVAGYQVVGEPRWLDGEGPTLEVDYEWRPAATVVRTYRARTQELAAPLRAEDALEMRRSGYVPLSETWSEGTAPSIPAIVAWGVLGAFVKEAGTLTVTYGHRPEGVG